VNVLEYVTQILSLQQSYFLIKHAELGRLHIQYTVLTFIYHDLTYRSTFYVRQWNK